MCFSLVETLPKKLHQRVLIESAKFHKQDTSLQIRNIFEVVGLAAQDLSGLVLLRHVSGFMKQISLQILLP
jgi:hypothetical protein